MAAHVIARDLTQPGAAADVFASARGVAGRIDILVNNAGFGTMGPFRASDLQTDLDMIRLNIEVLTELSKHALPDLIAAKGKLLNVASTAAFQPGPLMAIYYATKAYVLSFTEALAEELAPEGVTVTALCPGPTRTGFQARADIQDARLFSVGAMSARRVAKVGVDGLFARTTGGRAGATQLDRESRQTAWRRARLPPKDHQMAARAGRAGDRRTKAQGRRCTRGPRTRTSHRALRTALVLLHLVPGGDLRPAPAARQFGVDVARRRRSAGSGLGGPNPWDDRLVAVVYRSSCRAGAPSIRCMSPSWLQTMQRV